MIGEVRRHHQGTGPVRPDALGHRQVLEVRQAAAELRAQFEAFRRTGLALKGPLTTPVGGGFRSVNVRLREEFGLFANVRPVRSIVPGGRFENIDLVLIRENVEGLYLA